MPDSGIDFLSPFDGILDPVRLAEGFQAIHANAKRLIRDGRILFKARRYATAADIGVAAIGEISKTAPLFCLAGAVDEGERKYWWRQFRATESLVPWIPTANGGTGAAEAFDQLLLLVKRLRSTDCIGSGRWTDDGLIGRQLADEILKTAESFMSGDPLSLREIEIWIEVCRASEGCHGIETLHAYQHKLELQGFGDRADIIGGLFQSAIAQIGNGEPRAP